MFKRYWVHGLAAVGCVTALILAVIALLWASEPDAKSYSPPPNCDQPKQSADTAEPAKEKQEDIPKRAAAFAADNLRREKEQEVIRTACNTTQEHYNNREDLDAQRRMADAADRQVYWTRSGFLGALTVSILDLVLLSATLMAAVWAGLQAKRAANAGWAAISDTRQTTYVELRAYLTWETGAISFDGHDFQLEIQIRNTGQTPAYNVTYELSHDVYDVPEDEITFGQPDVRDGKSILGPGAIFPIAIKWPEEDRASYTLINAWQIHSIYVWGRIKFKDAYGRAQWTIFRYRTGAYESPGKWQLHACKNGNDASHVAPVFDGSPD